MRQQTERQNQERSRLQEELRTQRETHLKERRDQDDRHDNDMRQFRNEQERKDQENRRLIDELKKEHAAALAKNNLDHETNHKNREGRHKDDRDLTHADYGKQLKDSEQNHESTRLTKDE